uniref:Uncharacterized protein n=2 Tax=Stomoxys calcitrans TaxID=35570 RepID=A0A1I8NMP6_STOCA
MQSKVFFLIVALNGLGIGEGSKRPFNVELHNISYNTFTDLVQTINCDFKKLALNRYAVNAMFELSRNMPQDTDIEILIHYRLPKGIRTVKFLNLKLRVCDILTHVPTVPLIKEILNKLARVSNLPFSCPIHGNKMYNVTNLIVTEALFPIYAPIVNFNFTLNFFEQQTKFAFFQVEGSTLRKT